MSQLDILLSSSSSDETELSDSEVEDNTFNTPEKRRYRRALKHGLSQKRARYHLTKEQYQYVKDTQSLTVENAPSGTTINPSSSADFSYYETLSSEISSSEMSSSQFSSSEISDSDINDSSSEDSYSDSPSTDSRIFFEQEKDENDSPYGNAQHNLLYDGCQHSYLTSYTMVMLFVMKHSLSKEAFLDLLLLIRSHLPVSNDKYCKSVYKMKDFLKQFMNIKDPTIHTFCDNCHQLLDNEPCTSDICRRGNAQIQEFHDLHLEDQLKDLFQDSHFCDMVQTHRQQHDQADEDVFIKDICDGSKYKEVSANMRKEENALHLTFTMNTDGVALFSSSKKGNLWPIYVAINEIPIKQRFSKKFILPCYLYCQSEKPNMLTYMAPLMKTMKRLSEEGMEVVTPNGKLLIKAYLLAVTVDLPARPMVSNMKQFNGKFGCSFCMDEGEGRPNCPMHRFWPYKENSVLRTQRSYIDDVQKAIQAKEAVHGIKGACPLLVLRYVDIPQVFVVDWMHCVLLGVTKALMKLWFATVHRTDSFYVGDKLPLLNQRLQKIQIPDFMSRRQRSLEDHSHWKATECREWLLHFSVPVLEGILKPPVHAHYILLVSALNLLNQERIGMLDIDYAEMLLLDFCKLYPGLYGDFQQTMNVHRLKHLPHFVRLYGPLFATSCFGFESMNAHLKRMVHGTRFVNSQVSLAVGITKALPQLVKTFEEDLHEDLRILAVRLTSNLRSSYLEETSNRKNAVLGKPTTFQPTEAHKQIINPVLQDYGLLDDPVYKFYRLYQNKETFYSKEYQRAKTRNSYTVLLDSGDVGIVSYYLAVSEMQFAMVEKLVEVNASFKTFDDDVLENNVLRKYDNTKLCQHIKQVESHKEIIFIPASSITKKCVYMKLGNNKTYVSVPPNLLEHS